MPAYVTSRGGSVTVAAHASHRQPRNRARVDVVAPGDVAERFAPVAAANRLAALVRGELEGSA